MIFEKQISESIVTFFIEKYKVSLPEGTIQIQKTRKEFEGDFTLVVFPFVKIVKKAPEQIAGEIGEFLLSSLPIIDSFNVIKGFLNLVIKHEYWLQFLQEIEIEENYGSQKINEKSNPVLVEFSSPNTNKPLHLGHIRNNLLGFSLSKILEANGKKVIKVNLVNDRGIHICKSMLAWQKWGKGETPEASDKKGDHLVGEYYVVFEKKLKKQLKTYLLNWKKDKIKRIYNLLNENEISLQEPNQAINQLIVELEFNNLYKAPHKINRSLKRIKKQLKTNYYSLAQKLLVKWEANDKEVRLLWKMMNSWVYEGFDKTYKTLGVEFDKIYYESETYLLGKEKVLEAVNKGLLKKDPDQSVWIDLTDDGLDRKILLRSDGTSVYITQDIGTAIIRHDHFEPSKMLYVVGNEQEYHFKVLTLIMKKLGYDWSDMIHHISYGMVELPDGKMKSREGTIVDADNLLQEMFDTAREMSAGLGKLADFPESEKEKIIRTIGLGALKYFILKVDPRKNMLFNPAESIDFNGNTGPFIQYTYARIKSVFRKADESGIGVENKLNSMLVPDTKEMDILKMIYDFPARVREAGEELSPAIIANYLYELAKDYNQFYHESPILKEQSADKRDFRLILSASVSNVIKSGMELLGIEVPERM